MRLFPRSFLWRTILITVVPLVLALGAVGQAFFGNHWSRVQREMSRGLSGEIATLLALSDSNPDLARQMARDIGINMTENDKLARPARPDNGRREVGHLDGELKRRGVPAEIYIEKSKRLLFIDVAQRGKITTFATTLRRVYSSSTELFVLLLAMAAAASALLIAPFVAMHARSVRRLGLAAAKFGRGMSMPGFAPSGSREIREAAGALIAMKDRLDRYNRTRTDMLNAVSHDLKSPLARMKLAIESGGADPKKLVADIDGMGGMINAYLAFARGEASEIEQEISLAPMLARIIRDSGAQDRIILKTPVKPMTFYARGGAVSSAVFNILDNAVRHAKSRVEVTETDSTEQVEITVDDDGPGIPSARRAEALRPFVRLDAARSRNSGGSGLGLSIAQTAVENHGGRLYLEDSPLGGLRVRMTLPV
jgi:two-component system osmolarity sensor histidine kinase EnvZ